VVSRVDFTFTVAYDEDLDGIREVVTEIVSSDARIVGSPPFQIVTEELTEIGVRLRVLPTVAPDDYWAVRRELREQVKAGLDTEGIRFAIPPRDVAVRQPQPARHTAVVGRRLRVDRRGSISIERQNLSGAPSARMIGRSSCACVRACARG
jgi:small-conductance mechanosensitive channel